MPNGDVLILTLSLHITGTMAWRRAHHADPCLELTSRPMREPILKYAVVTGAAGSIGSAIVTALVSEGWSVCALDVRIDGLKSLGEQLQQDRILLVPFDVRGAAEWSEAAAKISKWTGGRLGLLVNNAALVTLPPQPLSDMSIEQVRRIVDVNLMGVINGIMTCLPLLEATPGSGIINISSISAQAGWPYACIYSATKAAVRNITEALAIELSARNIFVADITPGFIDSARFIDDPSALSMRTHLKKWGVRFGKPELVANAVVDATRQYRLHRFVGLQAQLYAFLTRLSPRLARLICRRLGGGALYWARPGTYDVVREPGLSGGPPITQG